MVLKASKARIVFAVCLISHIAYKIQYPPYGLRAAMAIPAFCVVVSVDIINPMHGYRFSTVHIQRYRQYSKE